MNRPEALNALNTQLMREILGAAQSFDGDPNIGCIIIAGDEKIFAAGADSCHRC
ncbi:MAG: enoyl-CoA hydratase/isomerase family protein [Rhizobiaceae bacterium]|nr:enoyl-CoA hydratase/isomerase family protein [Rhizobiaceae bacterium]